MPTFAGNLRPEEYQPIIDERDELKTLVRRLEEEKLALQEALGTEEAVDRVVDMARLALGEAQKEDGEVTRLAEAVLAKQVVEPIIQEKVDSIVNNLRETRREKALAEVNDPDWVARVSGEYSQMFETDGTYRDIETTAQSQQRQRIRERLIEQRRAEIDEALLSPEEVDRATAEAEEQIKPELDAYRDKRRSELPQEYRDRAFEEGRKRIDREVAEETEGEFEEAVQAWLKTRNAANYREESAKREKARRDEAAQKEGQIRIDGELITRSEIIDKYLRSFEHEGIELSSIPEGVSVTMALGQIKTVKNPAFREYNYGGNNGEPRFIDRIEGDKRVMILISKGRGMFLVKHDSLEQEEHPLLRELHLRGKVISVGRHVENQSNGEHGIEHRIASGEVPCFDDDTTSPDDIIDSKMPVANIWVAGVPAIEKYADILVIK